MSARLSARTAVVCILISEVAIAQPVVQQKPRRPVAVIDLSETDAGGKLATDLGTVLNTHEELRPIDDLSLLVELRGAVVDEDKARLESVQKKKAAAADEIQNRRFTEAAGIVVAAKTELWMAAPTPDVLMLYAELVFLQGYARLGTRDAKGATTAFRLAHTLDPTFAPDAARTLPEVVEAFEQATRVTPPNGTLAVGGLDSPRTWRVIIDGTEMTNDKTWYPVPAGDHVVWIVGTDRDPRGGQFPVEPQKKINANIDAAPTSKASKVRRARTAYKLAPDPAARAGAMNQLATLLAVHDAVLLTSSNNKTIVQTWGDKTYGFSALREWKNEKPAELLYPIAPPKKTPRPKRREDPTPIEIDNRGWIAKHKILAASGGSVLTVLLVAAVYSFATWDRTLRSDPNPIVRGDQ